MVFFCKFVHLFALLFCPSECELWFAIDLVSEKAIVNTCNMSTLRINFLAASFRLYGTLSVLRFFNVEHHDSALSH